MAAKKKIKRKSKPTAGSKMKRMKRLAKKKPAVKRGISKKVFAKNGSKKKKGDVKTKSGGRKTIGSKAVGEVKKRLRRKSRDVNRSPFPREGQSTRSGSNPEIYRDCPT
jgi:hypothetical protein